MRRPEELREKWIYKYRDMTEKEKDELIWYLMETIGQVKDRLQNKIVVDKVKNVIKRN